tara:strand:- start:2179 stop:2424 length:246 start_codon:yes stop_codon:yes gene_type:complete
MILKKKAFHVTMSSSLMQAHKAIRDVVHWDSSNGTRKLYKELDINHLKNIVAKIERGELDDRLHQLFDLKNEIDYRNLENE